MARFNPFEVTIPHIIYLCLGAFVVLFGMFSLFLRERLYIGEACWAFLFGVIIGPYCANIFNPRSWGDQSDEVTNMITLEFTRVVLATGVFAIGVELPKAYMKKHWKSLFFLLAPVMTWGWFVSAGLIYALIPGLNFLSSLAIAACLTPTDPILAAAVVGGKWADKHVPAHLRHLLAAESGCNDGAAFPFLFIALYLTLDKSTGGAIKDWFLLLWLYQVVVGTVIGAIIGFSFRHLMKFCTRRDLIDRHSYVAQYVSLAMLTIGVCTLLGSDDLLAAFACGTAFAWDGFFNRQTEESNFSSVIDLLFNIAAFVYVGAWMPFDKFQDAELTLSVWRLIVIAILVLLLKRLPVMVALYKWIPDVKTFREAVFSGHFGPIGIGAVFISTLANEAIHESGQAKDNHQIEMLEKTIQPIVAFMVLCSVAVHGLSIPGFSLGRRVHSVSRTWSRREVSFPSGANEPEWANQTRRVTRAEDVVVNRDRDEKEDDVRRGQRTGTGTISEEEKTPVSESSDETRVDERREVREDGDLSLTRMRDSREEVPPDGDEVLAEWYEPHHKITEIRRGPGEDVEVMVTPLVPGERPPRDEEEGGYMGGGGGGGVLMSKPGELAEERHKWHLVGRHAEQDIRRGVHRAEEGVRDIEERARHALGGRRPVHQRTTSEDAPTGIVSDDGEEGWASDRSSGGEASTSHAQQDQATSGAGGPSTARRPRQFEVRAPRRRNSSRRGSISSYLHATTDSDERGRDSAIILHPGPSFRRASRPSVGTVTRSGTGKSSRPGTSDSLRPPQTHSRVESLRASRVHLGREASPARSVRFADEDAQTQRGSGSFDVTRGSVDNVRSSLASPSQLQIILSPGVEAPNVMSDSPVEEQEQAARSRVVGDSGNSSSRSNTRSGTTSSSGSSSGGYGGRGRGGHEDKT